MTVVVKKVWTQGSDDIAEAHENMSTDRNAHVGSGCVDMVRLILPDFPGLNSFTTVILQVHIADLPYTPWLCHPDILPTVTEAGHHLIHLTHINTTVTCLIPYSLRWKLDYYWLFLWLRARKTIFQEKLRPRSKIITTERCKKKNIKQCTYLSLWMESIHQKERGVKERRLFRLLYNRKVIHIIALIN